MAKKRSKAKPVPKKFLHLSYITAILAFAGSLILFYTSATALLFFLPLFVMAALIFAVIDFVLIAEHPMLVRKFLPVLSVLLSIIAFVLYIIGLGRIA